MSTVIIVVILAAVCVYSARSYLRKLSRGGGCCGEHEAAEKKVRVTDRDKSHYPYTAALRIDGMTCGNCARRVENALNRMEGTWANADFAQGKAVVRTKQPADAAAMRKAVGDAGYTVLSVETTAPD